MSSSLKSRFKRTRIESVQTRRRLRRRVSAIDHHHHAILLLLQNARREANHGRAQKRLGNPRHVSLRRSVPEHQIGIGLRGGRRKVPAHEINQRLFRERKRREIRATSRGKRGRGYLTRRDEERSEECSIDSWWH